MDDSFFGRIFTKITIGIVVVALFDLLFLNWWILKFHTVHRTDEAVSQPASGASPVPSTLATLPTPTPLDSQDKGDGEDKIQVENKPSSSGSTSKTEEKVVVQTAEKEIFIPLGMGSTTASDYTDLGGVEVTIDTSKYPTIEGVYFEAAIWVEGGNGRAHAQIYNVNDKNAYIESHISNEIITPTLRSSNKIPIASGSKTYRVRAKTELSQYAAHVDSARLKIVLK